MSVGLLNIKVYNYHIERYFYNQLKYVWVIQEIVENEKYLGFVMWVNDYTFEISFTFAILFMIEMSIYTHVVWLLENNIAILWITKM